ncbi:MAG: hypothetical protein A2Y45_03080 [Tenericutes bacterium GWC2_34_14]|nr:MAG: hypothetical protein A2Z84_04030 [Tenericutes bacterium GWA2_35_7]OHE29036.1 MAG: hypothetical protein A2Y45_03080 [Tenericutes bacterium GWC2_34_14]OHE33989.1 MAG: hypothetical protein A2012_06620 [Tenericutes bacterium GWE2_34_108]OHE35322.1 MAG: hypothetical protein A2Y46_04340 [Tenericutes bacterium GWF1_35_14]OHE38355.1 MAG: hypothetical protein A2Y44_03650 [Tenericutes bacterium GWF2_35_184]OHE42690.1 MAG: hypothetical protein A2221_08280 [Tenericutes bacterium RIFOXYA2_FULL_36_3
MRECELKTWYQNNHISLEKYEESFLFLSQIEGYLKEQNLSDLDGVSEQDLDQIVIYMMRTKQNDIGYFIMLMRYYKMINHHENFIRLTQYTGGYGVIESILKKLIKVMGGSFKEAVLNEMSIPFLGTSPSEMVYFTKQFITWLDSHLDEEKLRLVLSDNHHQIPRDSFIEEKLFYEASPTLEVYLKDLHLRKIKELELFYNQRKVWYEQEITPEVIDYVKSNQEIMSAVLKDDALYITKIPYDTKKFLEATSIEEKNYYLCHCPFARESINQNDQTISSNWCYCSGGFTKLPFDAIFDQDLKIELISSALHKDGACRFKIDLSNVSYKK